MPSNIDSSDESKSEHRRKMDKITEEKIDSRQKSNTFYEENTVKFSPKNDKEKQQHELVERKNRDMHSEIQKLWRRYKLGNFKESEYKILCDAVFKKYGITKQEQRDLILRHFKN